MLCLREDASLLALACRPADLAVFEGGPAAPALLGLSGTATSLKVGTALLPDLSSVKSEDPDRMLSGLLHACSARLGPCKPAHSQAMVRLESCNPGAPG